MVSRHIDAAAELEARTEESSWLTFAEEAELLTASLQKAVEAIASNSVDAFACEIAEQQERCLRLLAALQAFSLAGGAGGQRLRAASCSRRLGRTLGQLQSANNCYGAVLEHSGKTHRMLRALLAQGYGGKHGLEAPHKDRTIFFHG